MKRKALCILLCIMFYLSGCSGEKNEATDSEFFSYDNIQLGYDAQPFFTEKIDGFAKVENGYYYWDSSSKDMLTYLMYFDIETGKAVPVCSKADCLHNSADDCDAIFGNSEEGREFVSYLWYYAGNLYTFVSTNDYTEREYYIYQLSLDGSTQTKYIKLFDGDIDGLTMYCHRGYVYAALNVGEETLELYKVKLEKDAKLDMVYSFEGIDALLYDFVPYKTGIAFIYSSFTDDTYSDMDNKILYFEPETNEVTEISENIFADSFRIIDDNIYYTNGTDLYVYNIKTDKNTVLYEFEEGVFLSYDGKYLYADTKVAYLEDMSKHYVYVFNLDGELIDSIPIGAEYICYFGDEDYMFQLFNLNEDLSRAEESIIKAFDKKQIGTGTYDWIGLTIKE